MTKKETAKIIFLLKEYYPNSLESSDLENRVNAWYLVLKDNDFQTIQAAMMAFVTTDTKGFMPSVGQLIEKAVSMTTKPEMTELEAWGYVSKALRNSTYGAEEEFAKLPPHVKEAVGSHHQLQEWAMMDASEVETVISSNFQRSFRTVAKRGKDYMALPRSVKNFISNNSGVFKELPTGFSEPDPENLESAKRALMEYR